MDESKDVLTTLIDGIAKALKPLADAVVTTEGLLEILDEIGANPSEDLTPGEQEALRSALELALAPLTNPSDVRAVISNLPNLMNTFTNQLPGALADVGSDLVDALIVNLLQREAPLAHAFMMFLGLSELEQMPPSRLTGRVRSRWKIRWERIPKILSAPELLFEEVYGWGTEDFNPESLLRNLRAILLFAGIPAGFQDDDQDGIRAITAVAQPVLRAPALIHEDGSNMFEAGLALLPTRGETNVRFDGLALVPFGVVQLSTNVDLGEGWTFHTRGGTSAAGGFGLILKEQGHLALGLLDGSDSSGLTIDLSAGIEKSSLTESVIIFGGQGTSRLEVGAIGAYAQAEISLNGEPEFRFEAYIHSGRLVVSTAGSDSFISKILPPVGFEAPFEVVIGWSNLRGVYFRGSASLEITIPIHASLGPIELEALHLVVMLVDDPALLEAQLGLDVGAKMGPISISISRVGVQVGVSISRTPDFSLGFLPPTGAGLVLAAGPVVGGGFLEIDTENERYAGILQLEFKAIGLVAIGLITTRMPDGSRGFSMLMSINVTFNPAITLPYNFKLIGVGGLIGIHRSMIIEVIRQGLKNRTLDSIMFPEDPILNAAKIISDLRAVFPPTEDRFVLGPMAKLGWNSPPLITGDIGILIEIPQPVRIAILGQLALVLPKKEKAIVEIHLDMLGVIDFDKCLFSFDASLYDSKILTYTLSGDSAMRLSWGAEPNFALAVGGLHPRFKPPPKFPTIRRLRLSLGSGNNPRINLETYQAVTSNSTQFGAKLEVYAKKGKFSIQGYLGFDALFIFSPFSFAVEIGAGVSVKAGRKTLFSVSLDLTLAGTSPWRAKGKATFKILFVKIKIRFDKSWGKRKRVSLPEVDPTEQLLTALKDSGNWAGILPVESQMAVSLRTSEEETDGIVVHPMGRLEIRQRVLPLGVTLEKFGNAPVTGPGKYTIDDLKTGTDQTGFASLSLTAVKDYFARAQFENLSNAKKLSSPSFEKFNAGVRAGSDKIEFDHPVSYTLAYETEVIDENRVAHTLDPSGLPWRMGKYFAAGSAARLGAMRNAGSRKYSVYGKAAKVRMKEEEYVIVSTKDMKAEQGIPNNDRGMSYSQAQREYEEYVGQNPEKRGEVQVVLKQEVVA